MFAKLSSPDDRLARIVGMIREAFQLPPNEECNVRARLINSPNRTIDSRAIVNLKLDFGEARIEAVHLARLPVHNGAPEKLVRFP